jgi:hypothetical protein
MANRRYTGVYDETCGSMKIYIAECDGVKKDYPILKSGKNKFFEWGSMENRRRSLKIKIEKDVKDVEVKVYSFCYFVEYDDYP